MDAAGRGGDRTYTYLVPDALTDLEPGEAVLVEFGRRQALGIVLAEAGDTVEAGFGLDGGPVAPDAPGLKPIVARVRADGPLLPRLTLALAGEIAAHYLAPPALVLRAMLPPGLLERLELVAEVLPGSGEAVVGRSRPGDPADPVVADLLGQLERGPKPVRDLAGPDGRAGLLRRLRSLDSDGRISLEWTLLGAGAGPRYERWVRLTDAGREAVAADSVAADAGGTTARTGRPLGPRQVDALRELAAGTTDGQGAADLSGHHGSGAVTERVGQLWGGLGQQGPVGDVEARAAPLGESGG